MTNLIASRNKGKIKYITPENALIFIPVCIGLFVTGLLITTIFVPLRNSLLDEKAQIEVLENKIILIPTYMKYIKQITDSRNKANNQQKRLIKLISDPNELKTLLSEINSISLKNDLEIIDIKSKPIVKFADSKNESTTLNRNIQKYNKKNLSDDPFLIPTIEKHAFNITLNGNYINILNFLKELELFQTISIIDSIDLQALREEQGLNTPKKSDNLKIKFELSTYSNIN
tara:strand:- start:1789 stop:2478 length:690 start_codon:yes stop_codon:yes gene_type:complete